MIYLPWHSGLKRPRTILQTLGKVIKLSRFFEKEMPPPDLVLLQLILIFFDCVVLIIFDCKTSLRTTSDRILACWILSSVGHLLFIKIIHSLFDFKVTVKEHRYGENKEKLAYSHVFMVDENSLHPFCNSHLLYELTLC
jgi:hypothetical protein